jgi:hypothetical protein
MAYTSINKPSDYFNTKLYTGNGSTNAITGVGFQPDWVWLKDRTSANSHGLFDVIRGATNALLSNTTNATVTNANYLQSFDTDGFTLGSEGAFNTNTNNYASWNWLASNTTASNTDGDITSTVSANTTSGFSISQFTVSGSGNVSFGHGLGAKPKVVITKSTSHTTNWNVYHEDTSASPENDYLFLNATDAKASSTDVWGDGMTTSVVGLGVDIGVSVGRTYVAYCFAEKKGFSKFGSYTGNGSADGPMVYTGFKPAFYMTKRTDTTSNWHMYDAKRDVDNSVRAELRANTTDAEVDVERVDFLSNGIKTRNTGAAMNTSGGTYIYMAFAENPFTTSTGVPTTAR